MTAPLYSAPLNKITDAVLALARTTGNDVYDGAYAGPATNPRFWYSILYRLAGGSSDTFPDLSGNPQAVTVPYQLTVVSNSRTSVERGGSVIRDRILGRNRDGWVYGLAMPDGWACTDRRADPTMPGIDRSGDGAAAIYSLPFRFQLTITPA